MTCDFGDKGAVAATAQFLFAGPTTQAELPQQYGEPSFLNRMAARDAIFRIMFRTWKNAKIRTGTFDLDGVR